MLVAKERIIPLKIVAVREGCLGLRPNTPCRSNLYASGLNSRSVLDQHHERGSTERIEVIRSWDLPSAVLRSASRCGAVALSHGSSGY
jgi:hypothetical protein